MKSTLTFILTTILFSIISNNANGFNTKDFDGGPTITGPEIIHSDGSNTGDNRDNTFPFSISFDETDKALVISYDQDRPASLDLTDRNGVILTHQSINTAGTYYLEIPQETGRYYLFMTTPEFYAYITISFTLE